MVIQIVASAVTIAQSAPAWVPILLSTASTVTTGFLNKLVGNEYNRETQLLIENKRQQAQLAQMKFQCLQHESTQSLQRELQASNHEFQLTQQQIKIASDQELQANNHEFQFLQQKDSQKFQVAYSKLNADYQRELQANNHEFQFLQQKDSQKFQVAYSKLNADYQRELQEFIQECNSRLQRDSQAFLAWKWEQEKSLQLSLTEYARETQLIMAAFNRETTMQSIEENHILQNWPLKSMPSLILKHSDRMPLWVILAPPDVDYDKFANQNIEGNKRKIPNLEKGLSAGLREFVSSNYSPSHQPQRVVHLLDGAWESKKHHDGASILALHSKLSSESILILQSNVDGDRLNFDYYFWSNGCESIHQSLLANYNFVDILYDSAKKRAREWQPERDRLLELGLDPVKFHQIDTHNLALLEEEDELKQNGIDISKIQPRYIPIDKDFDNLKEWLLTHHLLILALCTDVYYLVQANTTPLLPQLLPELFPLGIDPKTMDFVLTSYENTIDSLAVERSTLIPDLYLDLAQTFQTFSDRTYIRRCLFKSLQALFHLRHNSSGLLAQDLDACLLVPKNYLTTSDRDYVHKLNACLEGFGINFVDICLQCGIDLARQKDYYSAIAEFNLLISLDAKIPSAYFNRGLAHFELKQYSDAIANFTDHLNLAPNSPDTYSSRGNVYYQQREYDLALQDYDFALSLSPNHLAALKGKDLTYQAIAEALESHKGKLFTFEALRVNNRGEIIQTKKKQARCITENLPQGVTLDMVYISGGTFLMGSPTGVGYDNEEPQHQVTLPSFFMGKYSVTQSQWRSVASLPKVQRDLQIDPSYFKGNNRPVEQISWHDAVEFSIRLSRYTGKEYRLPSEAEWEYACRADTTTPFYFGETITSKLANYNEASTTDVGSFPPNPFGLYDMHGNIWEWCADNWHDNYVGDHTNDNIRVNGGCSIRSPIRGGAFSYAPDHCRSAFRNDNKRDSIYNVIGFRVFCISRI